jgi:hypothetical protein
VDEKKQKRLLAKVDQIFEQLDDWRHLPTYQLERRADIFFSLYLPRILKEHTKKDINDIVIPEFPIHKKTLDPEFGNNQCFRADYLALSKDKKSAYLVELKTDKDSGRQAQDEYLEKASKVRLNKLLNGLRKVFEVTTSKRKYFCLLKRLEALGLISNLTELEEIMKQDRLDGFKAALNEHKAVKVSDLDPDVFLVCIQPTSCSEEDKKTRPFDTWISFEDVRKVVNRHKDPLSKRFAESLEAWEARAGDSFR